jgi:hypothetical protein
MDKWVWVRVCELYIMLSLKIAVIVSNPNANKVTHAYSDPNANYIVISYPYKVTHANDIVISYPYKVTHAYSLTHIVADTASVEYTY